MARRPKPWYRKARKAWFVTLSGVQHNLGGSKKEAFEQFHRLLVQPRARRVAPHSLAVIIDEFLEFCRLHRSHANFINYRQRLQRFVSRWPDLRPEDLRPFHVEKWADSYSHSRTTRRNYLRAVKRCMRWARQQGYIDKNPIEDLEVPSAEAREVVISPEEFARILTFVRDESFRQLLRVAWDSGCRPQEILKVTAAHVDVANSRWVFKLIESKMKKKVRVVYLTESSLAITQRLMIAQPHGPLFRNSRGKPWTTAAVACQWKRVRVRMGLEEYKRLGHAPEPAQIEAVLQRWRATWQAQGKKVTKSERELFVEARRHVRNRQASLLAPRYSLYAFRHSFATRALEQGIDALTVGTLLGHADGGSTLARVYSHLAGNSQRLLEEARRATK